MTNNPLERFNREANSTFGVHPGMLQFVKKVKDISEKYLSMVKDVEHGRSPKPIREPNIPQIPSDYLEFKAMHLKNIQMDDTPAAIIVPTVPHLIPSVQQIFAAIPVDATTGQVQTKHANSIRSTSGRIIKRPRTFD